jgi:hypothetical protein
MKRKNETDENTGGCRPIDTLDGADWARYAKAKRTTDPRKPRKPRIESVQAWRTRTWYKMEKPGIIWYADGTTREYTVLDMRLPWKHPLR